MSSLGVMTLGTPQKDGGTPTPAPVLAHTCTHARTLVHTRPWFQWHALTCTCPHVHRHAALCTRTHPPSCGMPSLGESQNLVWRTSGDQEWFCFCSIFTRALGQFPGGLRDAMVGEEGSPRCGEGWTTRMWVLEAWQDAETSTPTPHRVPGAHPHLGQRGPAGTGARAVVQGQGWLTGCYPGMTEHVAEMTRRRPRAPLHPEAAGTCQGHGVASVATPDPAHTSQSRQESEN